MNGKLILVTGGNRGLGYEVCKKALAAGAKVLMTSRNLAAGERIARQLSGPHPRSCICFELDQTCARSVDDLVSRIELEYNQQIGVLVNNAAIYPTDWTKSALDDAINTNYRGPIRLTQKVAPFLAPGAAAVMVSSGAGKLSQLSPRYTQDVTSADDLEQLEVDVTFDPQDPQKDMFAPAYAVSKAMLNRAVQILSKDPLLVDRGISINAACPGWCSTDMGGAGAPRTPQQGADSICWVMEHARPRVTGGFYRDGEAMPW